MRRLSVVLLLAVYQANEASCYRTRKSRDLTESNDDSLQPSSSSSSSDIAYPSFRRLIRDTGGSSRFDSNAMETMDTAETHIFPPAFAMIENQKKRERRNKIKSYLLVDVASVNDVPIVINAQVIPNDANYLYNLGFAGFGGLRRKK